MRSEPSEKVHSRDGRGPREPLSNFIFGASVASLLMLLIAASLFLHSVQTRAWLAQMRSQAAARSLLVKTPKEAASKTDGCPDDRPVLTGVDASGKSICRALGIQSCADGQYIAAIDPFTLQIRCADAGGELACPPNTYVAEFMWLGEGRTSFSCGQRLDPFIAWKFEPSLSPKGND